MLDHLRGLTCEVSIIPNIIDLVQAFDGDLQLVDTMRRKFQAHGCHSNVYVMVASCVENLQIESARQTERWTTRWVIINIYNLDR